MKKTMAAGRVRQIMIALAGVAAIIPTTVGAWGPTGHKEVGAIADAILLQQHHLNAARQVQALLQFPLATAGPWADCVKSVKGGPDHAHYFPSPQFAASCGVFEQATDEAEMEAYAGRNWNNCTSPPHSEVCNAQYHFADVPLQRGAYTLHEVGAPDQNIAEAIKAAIMVLEGKPAPAPFKIDSKREALLMLAHLVGDIHQPLHVGAVYLKANGARINPPDGTDSTSPSFTEGGNFLLVGSMTSKKPKKLHAEWDDISSVDLNGIVDEASAIPITVGNVESWPSKWATETISQAKVAYSNITFGAHVTGKGWPVKFVNRAKYRKDEADLQRIQLERAGARLAQILVKIWPD